jgi:hypothetical protein
MTHEAKYSVRNIVNTPDQFGLTLYEAKKALIAASQLGVIQDSTCVTRQGRCVAYFSAWTETVRPMYQANKQEKHVLLSWEGAQARPLS